MAERPVLTPREVQVLGLLCQGVIFNADLAASLKVSEGTAHFHVNNLLTKFGCGSRAELIARAFNSGYATRTGDAA
jgi:DNA-binding CsgD family transcriptional regulator